jgi:hypothetical protein
MSDENIMQENDWLLALRLNDDEVINDFDRAHKVAKLREALNYSINKYSSTFHAGLKEQNANIDIAEWLNGIECEILRIDGKGWQKGKVRLNLALEFMPDVKELPNATQFDISESSEPLGFSGARSPLDDIRQMDV